LDDHSKSFNDACDLIGLVRTDKNHRKCVSTKLHRKCVISAKDHYNNRALSQKRLSKIRKNIKAKFEQIDITENVIPPNFTQKMCNFL